MSRANRNIDDLIRNEHFVQWAIQPTWESVLYWDKWVLAHPERKDDVEQARRLIQSVRYKNDEKMPAEDYDIVLKNIVNYSGMAENKTRVLSSYYWKLAGIAASIALLFFVYELVAPNFDKEVAMVIKEAAFGKVEKITLADGTEVWLNSGSRLSYPTEFVEDQRMVNLKGEAFFKVSHDEKAPFIVKSGTFSTKVLGTSFNIAAYNESSYAVTVSTGKVKLKHKDESILLTRNQQGNYNELSGIFTAREVSSKGLSDWRFGILNLNGKLAEALKDVERKYGVKVVFDDPQLQEYEIAATFKNESLTTVLESIEFSMEVDITLEGNIVKVSKLKNPN